MALRRKKKHQSSKRLARDVLSREANRETDIMAQVPRNDLPTDAKTSLAGRLWKAAGSKKAGKAEQEKVLCIKMWLAIKIMIPFGVP